MNNLFLHISIRFQMLMDSEDGQDMVEYALVVALVALGAVSGVRGLAGGIGTAYSNLFVKLGAAIS
jgi:pilus assembly protein Flp/PilA